MLFIVENDFFDSFLLVEKEWLFTQLVWLNYYYCCCFTFLSLSLLYIHIQTYLSASTPPQPPPPPSSSSIKYRMRDIQINLNNNDDTDKNRHSSSSKPHRLLVCWWMLASSLIAVAPFTSWWDEMRWSLFERDRVS